MDNTRDSINCEDNYNKSILLMNSKQVSSLQSKIKLFLYEEVKSRNLGFRGLRELVRNSTLQSVKICQDIFESIPQVCILDQTSQMMANFVDSWAEQNQEEEMLLSSLSNLQVQPEKKEEADSLLLSPSVSEKKEERSVSFEGELQGDSSRRKSPQKAPSEPKKQKIRLVSKKRPV